MEVRTSGRRGATWALCVVFAGALPRAHGIPPTDADVDALVTQLIERLRQAQVKDGSARGSLEGEMTGVHGGGVTALATFAMLSAGVPIHDPTIERAVDYLAEHPLPGTYSRSLRAGAWSVLVQRTADVSRRSQYRRLLQGDADWLTSTLRADGFHGYDAEGTGGDHSCTQFGVLGAWAAERASAEISDSYWEKTLRHWLAHRNGDGSWAYSGESGGTATMTTAGVNTMFILLSQHLVRAETPYSRLRGVSSRGRAAEDVDRVCSAAERGLAWLSEHDLLAGGAYQLFGLERLGVASGRKFIGAVDWYRAGVESIPPSPSGVVDDAFRLLFLTYGRAPVLINKLQYGPGEDWNAYYRDLHFLTSYLSMQHERIYKWQIVSADAPLHDLLDAPLLLMSGFDPIALTPQQRLRLRDYVDAGGTIVGHADRASERFARSFREFVESTFGDRGSSLAPLPASHALFSAMHRDDNGRWASELRIEGAGNGLRTFVYLFPADVAGAWHQDLVLKEPDLFNLMVNLRVCSAPEYSHLPKRLRQPELGGTPASARGYLLVSHANPSDDAVDLKGAWHAVGARMSHELGLSLVVVGRAVSGEAKLVPDLIHLHGGGAWSPNEAESSSLVEAIRAGSMVWLEASGSRPAFVDSAGAVMKTLASRLGGTLVEIPADHPMLSGHVPAGRPVGEMLPNRWGRTALAAGVPRVQLLLIGERPAAVFTPFDLLATGSGQFLYAMAAYEPDESATLVRNLVLWCYSHLSGNGAAGDPREGPRDRAPDRLRAAVTMLVDAGDWGAATQAVSALSRLDPQSSTTSSLREALRGKLGRAMNEARDLGRLGEAGQLAVLLEESFPGAFVAASAPGEGLPTAERPLDEKLTRSGRRLPPELANIIVLTETGESDALTLLARWFDVDAERAELEGQVRDKADELKSLNDKAEDLASRQGARGGSGQRGGTEFARIAEQRKELEDAMRTLRARIAEKLPALSRISEQLMPHEARLRALGVRREKDRWLVGEEAPP